MSRRAIAEALYLMLLSLTLAVTLVLTGIWLTTSPMTPIEFIKLHGDLYAIVLIGVGTMGWAYRRLWGKR